MRVIITDAAWTDMLHIGMSIQENSPTRARTFVNELYDRCKELGSLYAAFSLVPGLEETGIRRRPYGNYLIFYRVDSDAVEILHVLHGAINYGRILFPEN